MIYDTEKDLQIIPCSDGSKHGVVFLVYGNPALVCYVDQRIQCGHLENSEDEGDALWCLFDNKYRLTGVQASLRIHGYALRVGEDLVLQCAEPRRYTAETVHAVGP